MSRLPIALFILLIALLSQSAGAAGLKVRAVEVELVAKEAAIRPGQPLEVGLRIRHDPHWHTYWRNAGDSGLATEVHWTLPSGFSLGAIDWPAPSLIRVGPLANFGFEDEIVLAQRLQVPAQLEGGRVRLQARADWLMCKDVCIPGTAELELVLPVERRAEAAPTRSPAAALFESMAARRPVGAGPVDAAIQDGGLSLRLPSRNTAPTMVRFFPYAGGLIDNPAPQTLNALDGATPAWRVQIAAAEGLSAIAAPAGDGSASARAQQTLEAALREAGFFSGGPVGVLEIDGQAFEVAARAAPVMPEGVALPNRFEERVIQAPIGAAGSAGSGGGSLFANAAARLGLGRETASTAGASTAGGPGASVATDPSAPSPPAQAVGPGDRATGGAGGSVPLGWAMVLALLGGLLLNLMPCVFPVIGLKVLGFAQGAGPGGRARTQALAFALGVLVSFWAMALILNGLESAGRAAGWGFQLQSPVFVALMGLLFVSIGLNLAGVFEFGLGMTRLGDLERAHPGGPVGSFGSGVLAVLVATPCTAPFMGSALGLTLGEPLPRVLAVFSALGLGMALPYLVLGLWPALLRGLPRPGPWMETLRQFLAFPMFLTAVWLAWVLAQQVDNEAWLHWSMAAILMSLAWWIHGRFVQRAAPQAAGVRGFGRFAALTVGVLAVWLALPLGEPRSGGASGLVSDPATGAAGNGSGGSGEAADGRAWQTWSPDAVASAQAEGRTVFVDFTAAWCVTCQVNKRLVLQRPGVVERMAALEVLKLHADWTRMDEGIRAELARHGRSGVPLYLVYRPGEATPRVLPEVLTPGIVLGALEASS